MEAAPADASVLDDLVGALATARDAAAALAGREPIGVRAVEPSAARRAYLVAFAGPGFLCLTAGFAPEPRARRVREAASASLLWETAEAAVDAEALRGLTRAVAGLLALGGDPPEVAATLEVVAARALELAAWRDDPLRAVASLPALDDAVALHERLVGAYARFVRASEPLVVVQDTLDPALLAALGEVERAAAPAGVAERLADRLARALPECEEDAEQIVAAHLTALGGPAH